MIKNLSDILKYFISYILRIQNYPLFIISLIYLVFPTSIDAQEIEINKTYDYSIYFVAHDLLVDQRDSSYYLSGTIGSSSVQNYFLLKTNIYGDTIWLRTDIDTASSGIYGLKVLLNDRGNIVVMSRKDDNNTGILFSEYNAGGIHISDNLFNIPNCNFYPSSFCYINNKAYVFAFEYDTAFVGGTLLTFDSTYSNPLINRFPNFSAINSSQTLLVTSDPKLAVCGDIFDSTSNQTQPAVCYVDTLGNIYNTTIFPDTGYCHFNSIKGLSNNRFCLSKDFHNSISGYKTQFLTLDSSFTIIDSIDFNDYTNYSSSEEILNHSNYFALTFDSSVFVFKEDSQSTAVNFQTITIPNQEVTLSGICKNFENQLVLFGVGTDGGVGSHSTFLLIISDTSNYLSINNEANNFDDITVFPTVLTQNIINFSSSRFSTVNSIKLINNSGQLLFHSNLKQTLEPYKTTSFQFPTSIPNGIYYLIINTNQSHIYKLIINYE